MTERPKDDDSEFLNQPEIINSSDVSSKRTSYYIIGGSLAVAIILLIIVVFLVVNYNCKQKSGNFINKPADKLFFTI